jgi:hypothetical protein
MMTKEDEKEIEELTKQCLAYMNKNKALEESIKFYKGRVDTLMNIVENLTKVMVGQNDQ